MQGNKLPDRNKLLKYKSLWIVAAIFLTICSLVSILCFRYYYNLQRTIKNENSGYLKEISRQSANNINRVIVDNFSIVHTLYTVIKNSDKLTTEKIQELVVEQQSVWKFHNMLFISENGQAYDMYGESVVLSSEAYIRETIVSRRQAMTTSQIVGGTECVLFALPVENITIECMEIRAIAVSYELSTLDRLLMMSAFEGRGYAHIIQKDGSIVVRSSSEFALQTGYNVLNSLSLTITNDKDDFQQVRNDIQNGQAGITSCQINDSREYMVYTPLNSSEWYLLTFVPIEVVNANSDLILRLTLIMCSFITAIFTVLLGCLMISFYRHRYKLEQIAYVDPITGGNTIQCFYENAHKLLSLSNREQYELVFVNIEKFKILNEQLGRKACDDFLKNLYLGIAQNLTDKECIGRLFADNFCILTVQTKNGQLFDRFENWYSTALQYAGEKSAVWSSTIIEFGVYVISGEELLFPHMIDRAKTALKEATPHIHKKLRYAIYDDDIRRRMFREKQLEDMMDNALKTGEFRVFLQPKYNTENENIGGAEALVRWQNTGEGMIYPDEFISLFEKNGFIVQLDLWVFEQVCIAINSWIQADLTPIKISVNCSRVHIKTPHFLDQYKAICKKWQVPPQYIEIELTENVVFGDIQLLTRIINEIHDCGFACAMDDFGSGYSSLNLIKDIPVDTLKLDKIFFKDSPQEASRTESVVNSIITMAKALNLETVAEGVEERRQVDMLKRLHCDYIQGYYFAKPMPLTDFEQLAFGKIIQNSPIKP